MAQTMRHARTRRFSTGVNNSFIKSFGKVTLSEDPQTNTTTRRGVGPTEDILAYSTGMMGRRF
jgi:hypothetical protein